MTRREITGLYRDGLRDAWRRRGAAGAGRYVMAEAWALVTIAIRRGLGRPIDITRHRRRPPGGRRRVVVGLGGDVRQAVRRLVSQPWLSLAAAGMLALAIGLTASAFTVVDALLVRPVPFHDPSSLVHVLAGRDGSFRTTAPMNLFVAWRESPAFDAVHGVSLGAAIAEDGTDPAFRNGAFISPGLVEMLGVRPILGRTFADGEGRPGSRDLVLLSERLWRTEYGADRGIIGRRVVLSGQPHAVVGVLPNEFGFPSIRTEIWRPMDFAALQPGREQALTRPQVYARLSRHLPPADARALATDVVRRLGGAADEAGFRPLAAGLIDEYSETAMSVLAGGVALVFLTLAANVASLLLARAASRRREFRVCSALGASRLRLVRQMLVENALLAGIATIAGGVLAAALVSTARVYLPDAYLLRSLNPIDLDARALAVTAAAGVLATMLAGLPPALLASNAASATALRSGTRSATETRAQRLFTRSLLVVEVALAVSLLASGAWLLRAFVDLVGADRGLRTDRVITASISLPAHRFDSRASRLVFADTLETLLRSTPGVDLVAMSYGLPPGGSTRYIGPVTPLDARDRSAEVFLSGYYVTPEFFRLYGIPVVEGRVFEDGDLSTDVIVAEALKRRLWGEGPAVGRSFELHEHEKPYRVVGVVGDLRTPSVSATDERLQWYQPLRVPAGSGVEPAIYATGQVMAGLRCAASCPPLSVLRERVRSAHPSAVIGHLGPLETEYRDLLSRPRAAAALAVVFGGTAGLTAAGGLFSVLTWGVGRRRREYGIRAALGARPRALAKAVVGEGLGLAALGLAIGVAAAWVLSRALASMLAGVSPADPLSWSVVVALILALTLAASLAPARRAMRVDPVTLLREQ